MKLTAIRPAIPALLLALLVLVPMWDKAFTIDDTLFLLQAKHVLSDPLHPTAFDVVWDLPKPERLSQILPSGPVMAWLLVPAVAGHASELIAHGIETPLLLLAILATVSLALRLGLSTGSARVAGLLLACTPAVLAMAGTAMPDVPAMALSYQGSPPGYARVAAEVRQFQE
ncbi:MAG TPA: hypothetical protein VMT17_12340 [Anaeromyxobacteraceae bacterium]|nr:hypothetical protein [Anaeromyxobacteraceae bacterium]